MIGVGGEGNSDFAYRFPDDYGVTFTMLWSDDFAAWRHYSVVSSSDVWLLDAAGNRLGEAPVPYDPVLVEQMLAGLT